MDAENCRHPSYLQYSILSTLQYSLQCSGRTTRSICIVVSTMQHNSLYNTLYLESLLTITFSLPHSYHFLTTFAFSSLSLSRYCSSRVPTFSIFEPFFPALFLDAIQIFLDFSLRLSSSRHVALREGSTSYDFIKTTIASYDLSRKVTLLVSRW